MSFRMILTAGLLCCANAGSALADAIALQTGYDSEQVPGNKVWARTGDQGACTILAEASTKLPCAVKYLTSRERQDYKLTWNGAAWVGSNGKPYDTDAARLAEGVTTVASLGDQLTKKLWKSYPGIWVMDTQNNLYVAVIQAPGKFHHSSFMAGNPVQAGGQIVIKNGVIVAINNDSGHYKPTIAQFQSALTNLQHFNPDGVWCVKASGKVKQCAHEIEPETLAEAETDVKQDNPNAFGYVPGGYSPQSVEGQKYLTQNSKYLTQEEEEDIPVGSGAPVSKKK